MELKFNNLLNCNPWLTCNSYLSSWGLLSFYDHFLVDTSINEHWSTLFIPNRYYIWHNKWVMQLRFVGLVGHKLSPRACCKLFTKFESNICITMTYTLYSCTLFLNVQYPTLTLQSTPIPFIYLRSVVGYRSKSQGLQQAFSQFQTYPYNEMQFASTMPLSHYIQSLRKFLSIFNLSFSNICLIVWVKNIYVDQSLKFYDLISDYLCHNHSRYFNYEFN